MQSLLAKRLVHMLATWYSSLANSCNDKKYRVNNIYWFATDCNNWCELGKKQQKGSPLGNRLVIHYNVCSCESF